MNRIMGSLLLVCAALAPAVARADEELPVSISTAPEETDPSTLTLRVQSPAVESLEVESTILDHGVEVGEPSIVTLSLTCPHGGEAQVVPSADGLIHLDDPLTASLEPGLYAESILVRAHVRGFDLPILVTGFRYFDVTWSSVQPISMSEYSRRVSSQAQGGAPKGEGLGLSGGGGALVDSPGKGAREPMARLQAVRGFAVQDSGEDVSPPPECDKCGKK